MMFGSGRSPATALLLNVPIKVRLNHFIFYIRQRMENNNPNVKKNYLSLGDQAGMTN